MHMNTELLLKKIGEYPLAAALSGVLFLCGTFLLFEPQIGQSQTDEFLVSQSITGELAFVATAADVTMNGAIAGLTGGQATGTTMAVVRTSNPTGYNMTLVFSSTTAMKHSTASNTISNYTPATPGTPDFTFETNGTGQSAEFGYHVAASTTGEVDASFMNNGSACGVSTSETFERCWLNPSTTAERIINSSGPSSASTSTIKFRVSVPAGASPVVADGTYIATGTLTITDNP